MRDDAVEVTHASTAGQRGLPRLFATVFLILSRIQSGAIEIELPEGRVFRAEGSAPGPEGRLVVRDPRLFARMLRHGEMGFTEAYLDGWWSSPDLQGLLDVLISNNRNVTHGFPGAALVRRLNRFRHWLNRNTRRQSKKNIEAHYDLGNAFYALWLDDSMTYSSAKFETPEEDLASAQRNKYRSICDRMDLREGDHVLEIGCGWGGFAEYAAGERGARVTGLTLSPAQLAYAQERIQRAGLSERVELVLRDYRDERGRYDGVASIEMFEAVGEQYWPSYFGCVRERLKPGARASLQVITIADHLFDRYRAGVDFVQKYIFPGGMLPCPSALRREVSRAGLEWIDSVEFGESYSVTLRRWFERFNSVWKEIEQFDVRPRFDDRFLRMWNLYLTSCAACFSAQTTDVTQIALRRA